jgi:hypothetical protein
MKIKIWPDDTTVPEMDDWLAELRDDGRAEPPVGAAEPRAADRAEPPAGSAAPGAADWFKPRAADRAEPPADSTAPSATERTEPPDDAWAEAPPEVAAPAVAAPAVPAAPEVAPPEVAAPEVAAPAVPAAPAVAAPAVAAPQVPAAPAVAAPASSEVRPLIGDQLRMPIIWCEMGSCISWHADPAALGEGDQRARAIEAGWRIDAFGRVACPSCQQVDPGFRATHPVVPWNRYTAMARAARITAARDGARGAPRALGWATGSL